MHIIIDAKTQEIIGRFHDSNFMKAKDFLDQTNRNGRDCWMVYMTKEEYLKYTRTLLDLFRDECYN